MQTGKSTTDLIADLLSNHIPKYGDMETKIELTINLPSPEPITGRIKEVKNNSQKLCNCGKGSCPLECNLPTKNDNSDTPASTNWFTPDIFGGRMITISNDLKIENNDKTNTNTHIDPKSEEVD